MDKRVLPADVYDALELSAEAFGGIGGGQWAERGELRDEVRSGSAVPYCVYGMAAFLDGELGVTVEEALSDADIVITDNDSAVRSANGHVRGKTFGRVPFAAWCAELGVVRGEP